jgi:hypothetical protein
VSIQLVSAEIGKFLAGAPPYVLCIRGPWGVGKTYSWNAQLEEAAVNRSAKLKKYAYISLFGINSLDALKAAIFENTVDIQPTKLVADEKTLGDLFTELQKHGRPFAKFFEQVWVVKNFVPSGFTAAISFLTVRKMIICFDDLERRGKGLELADVLGLASMLKERRSCRVALLLNEDELGDEKTTFQGYLEKVVDQSLRFDPTSAEAVEIAMNGSRAISALAGDLCLKLGLRNIRVMRKVNAVLEELRSQLKDFDPQVYTLTATSAALFVWSHLQPNEAPPRSFLMRFNIASRRAGQENSEPKEAAWNALLANYGYTHTDEFDIFLMDGVVNGYFESTALQTHAQALADRLAADAVDGSFERAWDLYHDSFDDNQEEVLDAIERAFRSGYRRISPTNLNGTVRLFKELGRADTANELINLYADGRDDPKKFFNLNEYSFQENITEPEVRAAFDAKAATVEEERDFAEMLSDLRQGWDEDTLTALSSLPVEEYYRIFKEAKGKRLRAILSGALSFDTVTNANENMKEIPRRAKEALKRIGTESPINARRAEQRGVKIPKADEQR